MDSDSDSDIDNVSSIMHGVFNASNMSEATGTTAHTHGQRPIIINQKPGSGPQQVPLRNGKKTRGRVKIKMEFIEDKLRRYTTFSKRKTGLMKKAYELSTLTGTEVLLLVASETGHVYTFATRKLQPMITSDSGKALIQTCLNSPDMPQDGDEGESQNDIDNFDDGEFLYSSPCSQNNDASINSQHPIYIDTSSQDTAPGVASSHSITGVGLGAREAVGSNKPPGSVGVSPPDVPTRPHSSYMNQGQSATGSSGGGVTIHLTPPASAANGDRAVSPHAAASTPLPPPPPSATVSISDIITPNPNMDKLTGLSLTPLLLTPNPWLSGTPFQLSSTLPLSSDNAIGAQQQTTAFRFPEAGGTSSHVLNLSSCGGSITTPGLMSLNTPTVTSSSSQVPSNVVSVYQSSQGGNASAPYPSTTVTSGVATAPSGSTVDDMRQYITIPVTFLPMTPGLPATTTVKSASSPTDSDLELTTDCKPIVTSQGTTATPGHLRKKMRKS